MKRDLSLCRELLLLLEKKQDCAMGLWSFPFGDEELSIPGYSPDDAVYNLARMLEADFFAERSDIAADGAFIFSGTSWSGHDYLDAVRDPTVWKETKSRAEKIGGWTFGIVKDLAVAYVKQEAAKHGFGA